MNSVDKILLDYQNQINQSAIKQGPKSEDIYQFLCSYQTPLSNLDSDVSKIVNYVDNAMKQYIGKYLSSGSSIDIVYSNKNQGNYFKHINIHFHKHLPSVSETLQVYLSIKKEYYEQITTQIYQYLLNNNIDFDSRLSKIDRNDNFVVSLYSKNDLINLVKYINQTNISDYLRDLNPFIYQINKVGIVKDVKGLPYNKYVSQILQDYIEECILNQQSNPYTSSDFQQYVVNKISDSDHYQEKLMAYNLSSCLFSIITGKNLFNKISDQYPINFEPEKLHKYQVQIVDGRYKYYENNVEVNKSINTYLNAQMCLYYLLLNNNKHVQKYQLNSEIVHKMLNDTENILTNDDINILINYKDKIIHQLIPYLYSYIAQKYKYCNEEECQKIVDTISNKMTYLDNIINHKYIYYINNQQIISSIPLIKNDKGLCAIEYIDEDEEFSNISVIKNGKVTKYLNVYLDIDKNMINKNNNYYCRLYRNAVSNALLNFERNEKALQMRQNDFSACFLSDKSDEVNKYANVAIIKQIYNSLNEKQIVNQK